MTTEIESATLVTAASWTAMMTATLSVRQMVHMLDDYAMGGFEGRHSMVFRAKSGVLSLIWAPGITLVQHDDCAND